MLDMGGAPSASNDQSLIRTVNISKNSKLQAVAFDFEVLTRTLDAAKAEQNNEIRSTQSGPKLASVQPDFDQVKEVASLLNISVDTGETSATSNTKGGPNKELPKRQPHEDIRAKYASKLQGGLAGIALAKNQIEDTLKGGDAAGHLAARKVAMQEAASTRSTKWMALSGTGKFLSYLTHRSIRIALLPNPKSINQETREEQQCDMREFSKQLGKDVVIDCIVELDKTNIKDESVALEKTLQNGVVDELGLNPNSILLVTDRDDYLKTAKDLGMLTCRINRKNTRRGNVTAHYTTPSISEVQEVVNEINGVSFNAVLNR